MEVDKDPRKRLHMDAADAANSSLPNQPKVLLAITEGSGVDQKKSNSQTSSNGSKRAKIMKGNDENETSAASHEEDRQTQ